MYLVALQGQGTSAWPSASGAPTLCTQGTNSPSAPSTSNTFAAHARHHAHAHRDVGAVGQLDADVGDVRAQRPHRERHDVHRAAAHAAPEQGLLAGLQQLAHLGRVHPVVGRAGGVLRRAADEGAVLDARHVARVAARQEAVRALEGVQPLQRAGADQLLDQALVLGLAAVAPVHVGGLGQGGDLGHPGHQAVVLDIRGHAHSQALHRGTVHRPGAGLAEYRCRDPGR
jgi:hypothetical protein